MKQSTLNLVGSLGQGGGQNSNNKRPPPNKVAPPPPKSKNTTPATSNGGKKNGENDNNSEGRGSYNTPKIIYFSVERVIKPEMFYPLYTSIKKIKRSAVHSGALDQNEEEEENYDDIGECGLDLSEGNIVLAKNKSNNSSQEEEDEKDPENEDDESAENIDDIVGEEDEEGDSQGDGDVSEAKENGTEIDKISVEQRVLSGKVYMTAKCREYTKNASGEYKFKPSKIQDKLITVRGSGIGVVEPYVVYCARVKDTSSKGGNNNNNNNYQQAEYTLAGIEGIDILPFSTKEKEDPMLYSLLTDELFSEPEHCHKLSEMAVTWVISRNRMRKEEEDEKQRLSKQQQGQSNAGNISSCMDMVSSFEIDAAPNDLAVTGEGTSSAATSKKNNVGAKPASSNRSRITGHFEKVNTDFGYSDFCDFLDDLAELQELREEMDNYTFLGLYSRVKKAVADYGNYIRFDAVKLYQRGNSNIVTDFETLVKETPWKLMLPDVRKRYFVEKLTYHDLVGIRDAWLAKHSPAKSKPESEYMQMLEDYVNKSDDEDEEEEDEEEKDKKTTKESQTNKEQESSEKEGWQSFFLHALAVVTFVEDLVHGSRNRVKKEDSHVFYTLKTLVPGVREMVKLKIDNKYQKKQPNPRDPSNPLCDYQEFSDTYRSMLDDFKCSDYTVMREKSPAFVNNILKAVNWLIKNKFLIAVTSVEDECMDYELAQSESTYKFSVKEKVDLRSGDVRLYYRPTWERQARALKFLTSFMFTTHNMTPRYSFNTEIAELQEYVIRNTTVSVKGKKVKFSKNVEMESLRDFADKNFYDKWFLNESYLGYDSEIINELKKTGKLSEANYLGKLYSKEQKENYERVFQQRMWIKPADDWIERTKEVLKIDLNKEQKIAMRAVINPDTPVVMITGGAGTGKSVIAESTVASYDGCYNSKSQRPVIVIVSQCGRMVSSMKSRLGFQSVFSARANSEVLGEEMDESSESPSAGKSQSGQGEEEGQDDFFDFATVKPRNSAPKNSKQQSEETQNKSDNDEDNNEDDDDLEFDLFSGLPDPRQYAQENSAQGGKGEEGEEQDENQEEVLDMLQKLEEQMAKDELDFAEFISPKFPGCILLLFTIDMIFTLLTKGRRPVVLKLLAMANIFIIDEAQNNDVVLFDKAMQVAAHCKRLQKIILLGDPHQIRPIGQGQVFLDLLTYGNIPKIKLIQNNRVFIEDVEAGKCQGEGSGYNAKKANPLVKIVEFITSDEVRKDLCNNSQNSIKYIYETLNCGETDHNRNQVAPMFEKLSGPGSNIVTETFEIVEDLFDKIKEVYTKHKDDYKEITIIANTKKTVESLHSPESGLINHIGEIARTSGDYPHFSTKYGKERRYTREENVIDEIPMPIFSYIAIGKKIKFKKNYTSAVIPLNRKFVDAMLRSKSLEKGTPPITVMNAHKFGVMGEDYVISESVSNGDVHWVENIQVYGDDRNIFILTLLGGKKVCVGDFHVDFSHVHQGYASTTDSQMGSESKYIIVVLNGSSDVSWTTRDRLVVALSRAKVKLFVFMTRYTLSLDALNRSLYGRELTAYRSHKYYSLDGFVPRGEPRPKDSTTFLELDCKSIMQLMFSNDCKVRRSDFKYYIQKIVTSKEEDLKRKLEDVSKPKSRKKRTIRSNSSDEDDDIAADDDDDDNETPKKNSKKKQRTH